MFKEIISTVTDALKGHSHEDLPDVSVTNDASKSPNLFEVQGVTDGDTICVECSWAPPPLARMAIRLRGIDTPEKGWRAKCPEEARLGELATAKLKEIVESAEQIEFNNLEWDKYGGRVLADVVIDGVPVAERLIAAGLAKPYDGGKKSSWCE